MINADQRSGVKSFLRALLPQTILLALIAVLYLLSLFAVIPSPSDLNDILLEAFRRYGLPLIALSSFLENLVGFNAYFPGAFTILTGMSLTAGHAGKAVLTYFIIYVPACVANVLSYFLGGCRKPGLREINSSFSQKIWLWFLLTYWHPQLASVTAFSAGVRNIPKTTFLGHALVASLFWSLFWAVIIYHVGLIANTARYFTFLFVVYVLIWAAIDTRSFLRHRRLG